MMIFKVGVGSMETGATGTAGTAGAPSAPGSAGAVATGTAGFSTATGATISNFVAATLLPTAGGLLQPNTSTGAEGPTSFTRLPFSSCKAFTFVSSTLVCAVS